MKAKPDLRPAESKTVQNIKDLKREIRYWCMATGKIDKADIDKLINEFEAHWKGEADRLDDGHAKTCKCCNCFVASIYRRILGEGGK